MAYAKLASITCWICSEPYQPTRPENKVHARCERARRKQEAAEKKWAKSAIRIPVEAHAEQHKTVAGWMNWGFAGLTPMLYGNPETLDRPLKILVVPDTQTKPGVPLDHLTWAGRYAAQKRPDVIVHLGDHWDMPSLSSYDKGKKSYEGRRYVDDIEAGNRALDLFDKELAKAPDYRPRKVFTLGNHEQRIERAIQEDRKLENLIGYDDFNLKQNGWEVHDFLKVVEIAGIKFAHYFVSGAMNKAVSSANVLLNRHQKSSIMGHNQQWQMATNPLTHQTAIFAGCFYLHNEEYLTPQGQDHRRQLLVLHEAKDGVFDLMQVSVDFLRRRFS